MILNLRFDGNAEPFVNYLKNFAEISASLLLEIDPTEKAFIAKSFTTDKASVRYSSISFEDCKAVVVSDEGAGKVEPGRIRVGILHYLPKFISMLKMAAPKIDPKAEAKEGEVPGFNIKIDYDYMMSKVGTKDLTATQIVVESSDLKMNMNGFRTNEFRYLADDKFNSIFKAEDPIHFDMSAAMISQIVKTSDIIKIDPNKDALDFYVDGKTVHVRSNLSGEKGSKSTAPSGFDQVIAELPEAPSYEISANIFREKFVVMMNKCEDDYEVSMGLHRSVDGDKVDRILFKSKNSNTKIILSIINE